MDKGAGRDGIRLGAVEVTTLAHRVSPADWLTVHRSAVLHPRDVTTVSGFRITTPPRTLIDIVRVVPELEVEYALEDALRRGLTSEERIRWQMQTEPKRPGTGAIMKLLDDRGPGRPAGSRFEIRARRCLTAAGLPRPNRQHPVLLPDGGVFYIDLAYPHRKLAIECESFRLEELVENPERFTTRIRELLSGAPPR